MKNRTDNLTIGSPAPAFTLAAANREGRFSLFEMIARGVSVIEFTRGTW